MVTTAQIFQIGNLVLSTAAGAGATFLALGMSQTIVTGIVAITATLGIVWNGVGAILTGQSGAIKEVAAMPGVTTIQTNNQANATLKAAANNNVDPAFAKVEPPK